MSPEYLKRLKDLAETIGNPIQELVDEVKRLQVLIIAAHRPVIKNEDKLTCTGCPIIMPLEDEVHFMDHIYAALHKE